MEGAWKRWGSRKMLVVSFGGSATFLLGASFLVKPGSPTFLIALFYMLSEIPVFLSLQLIWVLAADYFDSFEAREQFNILSGLGLLGVSVASAAVLFVMSAGLGTSNLLPGWAFSTFLLMCVSLLILRVLKPLAAAKEEVPGGNGDAPEGFIATTRRDFLWMLEDQNRYLRLFALVTVCNFLLLAIFDQTLAKGSERIGVKPDDFTSL